MNNSKSHVKGMTACRAPEDDYISRQEAIDVCNYAIDLWHGQLGEGIVIAVRKKIAELPSVQPEPERTMEEFMYGQDMGNPEDGSL